MQHDLALKKNQVATWTTTQTATIAISILLAIFAISTCPTNCLAKEPVQDANSDTESQYASAKLREATFSINGASCLSCIRNIERQLRLSKGVIQVHVELATIPIGHVYYDGGQTNTNALISPLTGQGYGIVVNKDESIKKIPKIKMSRKERILRRDMAPIDVMPPKL